MKHLTSVHWPKFVTILAICCASLVLVVHVRAEDPPSAGPEVCRARIIQELTKRRDEERAAIFGARRDRARKISVLTGGEAVEERSGILETRERLTSELVEPIVQSYRFLRCRMDNLCALANFSANTQQSGSVQISVLGCKEETLPILDECRFTGTIESNLLPGAFCQSVVDDTLRAERAILKTAAAYDAGYRSMLQATGIMDWMMEGFESSSLRPIRDMVNMLGKLHTIPCFIGQCDAPTPLPE